eukprot:CAMPEP_0194728994 /NCGR_PEP_ID=MMETSP0296-20130528/44066_1 /TAXON_ID=39354 /ORGANISM="Heterosigma akashiwo, Strain CCMP2393" /LENGTH=44 /DNA_ID= /DNA_START= /DNA_END= /DNA_ORIENTATION=
MAKGLLIKIITAHRPSLMEYLVDLKKRSPFPVLSKEKKNDILMT